MVKIAQHESSGDPNAVGSQAVWYSAKYGYQKARGLMQVMPPTFDEYMPGGNINDPVDNMVAAIKYIKATYGDPNVALQKSLNGGY